jgi:mannose-6-phosphate isomerase-like protein (cupin superfamily)
MTVLGERITWKVISEGTGGLYSAGEGITPPGGGPPLHMHHREDEGFYILSPRAVCSCAPARVNGFPMGATRTLARMDVC